MLSAGTPRLPRVPPLATCAPACHVCPRLPCDTCFSRVPRATCALMGWFWIDLASSIPFEDLLHLFVLLTGNEEAFSGQPPMASECL